MFFKSSFSLAFSIKKSATLQCLRNLILSLEILFLGYYIEIFVTFFLIYYAMEIKRLNMNQITLPDTDVL